MNDFEILYEDRDILVVYKPAGLAVQTARLGRQDLESRLKNYRVGKREEPYIGIVHRLDQPVEGVMVFAKNPKSAASLSKQVKDREIGKYYYAVGCPKEKGAEIPSEGTLTDYLGFDRRKNLGYISHAKDPNAKKAVLDYRVIAEEEEKVCFAIELHTGRHHQIRLQLMQLGCPLLGDTRYGGPAAPQTALCSYRLVFCHPADGKKMDFSITPKNPAFADLIRQGA